MMITVPTAIPVCRLIPLCSTSHGARPMSAAMIRAIPRPQTTSPTTHWTIRNVIDDGIVRANGPSSRRRRWITGWRRAGVPRRRTRRTAPAAPGRWPPCPRGATARRRPTIGELDAFDDVACPRRDDESGAEAVDRLVVDAVPARACRAHRHRRLRAGDDVDVVVVVVVPGGGALADDVGEVLVQRAAEGDVEHLVTAADRQHRLVLGDCRRGRGRGRRRRARDAP